LISRHYNNRYLHNWEDNMSRELRLAFAMGGGVSLGSFSGATLAEAIKLALLFGTYEEDGKHRPYRRVVIDVFSGASAGAMALGSMLRILTHRTPDQTDRAAKNLARRLKTDYGLDDVQGYLNAHGLGDRYDALVAAQAVQDEQERLWIEEVNLDRLLGYDTNGSRADLRHVGSLLDRGAVDIIAREAIAFPGGVKLDGRCLLDKRVLFACTLANLTPVTYDATRDLSTVQEGGFAGLADGLTSQAHRDIRIFDLNFFTTTEGDTAADLDDPTLYPPRWCRYHAHGERAGAVGDLRAKRTWGKIAATAVASGAFPFAFEAVVLRRSDYEYGALPERDLDGARVRDDEGRVRYPSGATGQWPHELIEEGLASYPFSFVDGGTFNNEPIREAFRLSAFLDALRGDDPVTFDRRILFVDPSASRVATSFPVPIHRQYAFQAPNAVAQRLPFGRRIDGTDLVRRATADRLVAHAPTVIGAMLNQARVQEGDKVYQARDRFAQRADLRRLLNDALPSRTALDKLKALRNEADDRLASQAGNLTIPAGALSLDRELERVLAEEAAANSDFGDLRTHAADMLAGLKRGEKPDAAHMWLRALTFVLLDLAMDLEGKRPNSQLIAVTPVRVKHTGEDAYEEQYLEMPGSRLKSFGGFMSKHPNLYQVELARYCTWQFLHLCGLIQRADDPAKDMEGTPAAPKWGGDGEPPTWGEGEAGRAMLEAYERDVKAAFGRLDGRIGEIVGTANFFNLPSALKSRLASIINDWLVGPTIEDASTPAPERTSIELRVYVPGKRFEIDGKGEPDLQTVRPEPDGGPCLVLDAAFGERAAGDGARGWIGPFLDEDAQTLHVEYDRGRRSRPFDDRSDRPFCTLNLPGVDLVDQARLLPDPVLCARVKADDEGETLTASRWSAFAATDVPSLFAEVDDGGRRVVRPPSIELLEDRLGR
jgi:predicted acylesterase/phospholipase RssA